MDAYELYAIADVRSPNGSAYAAPVPTKGTHYVTYSPTQLRRVDVLVAELTGWKEVRHMYAVLAEMTGIATQVDDLVGCPGYGHGPSYPVPYFTREPSAAYLAIDWLRTEWHGKLRAVVTTDDMGTECRLVALTGHGAVGHADAETPAQAICFAVLKSRGLGAELEKALRDGDTVPAST